MPADSPASSLVFTAARPRHLGSLSIATMGVVASALLVYCSGAFMATAILGVKREMQMLLLVPVSVAAAYYIALRPVRLLDPLIAFAMVKLAVEVLLRGQLIFALDSIAAVLALMVIAAAPPRSVLMGVRTVVALAGLLAAMGLLQWLIITAEPHLFKFVLKLSDEEGGTEAPVQHFVATLGLMSERQYTLLGLPLGRMQSFAKEPSLNVLYFLFPAALAFLLKSRIMVACGVAALSFCVLSLSGSVFLSLAFAGLWWLLAGVIPIRRTLPYGMIGLMVIFLMAIGRFGSGPFLDAVAFLAQYADFLSKTVSLTTRSASALVNAQSVLASPFGSASLADLPGPMLVNAGLAAGWAGIAFLVMYFARLGRQLEAFSSRCGSWGVRRVGVILLLGALATILVFNDYQMNNYAGLIQLALLLRAIQVMNRRMDLHRREEEKT